MKRDEIVEKVSLGGAKVRLGSVSDCLERAVISGLV